jgi:hypothetical protein
MRGSAITWHRQRHRRHANTNAAAIVIGENGADMILETAR